MRTDAELDVLIDEQHYDGSFGWSIADGDGPHFSFRRYETEGEAMDGLWEAVEAMVAVG